jgi:hypothetical protein
MLSRIIYEIFGNKTDRWIFGSEALWISGEDNRSSEMHACGTSRSGYFCRGSRAGCNKSGLHRRPAFGRRGDLRRDKHVRQSEGLVP